MPRVVIEYLDRFAPHRGLRGVDLAQVQNVALHHTAACNTLVLDHAPILVRLAVFLARGFSQKHDRANLAARIRVVEQGRSSLQQISAVAEQYFSQISDTYRELASRKCPFSGANPRRRARSVEDTRSAMPSGFSSTSAPGRPWPEKWITSQPSPSSSTCFR